MKRKWKRTLSVLLTIAMLFSMTGMNTVFATEGGPTIGASGLCEHHPAHTADCGYTEGTPGTGCSHEHTDEDCYKEVTACVHEHSDDCYLAEDSVWDNDATPSDATLKEPTECTHMCSEESGCITKELDCQHEHDETCGYIAAVPRTPCAFVCEESAKDSGRQPSPQPTLCTRTESCTLEDGHEGSCNGAVIASPLAASAASDTYAVTLNIYMDNVAETGTYSNTFTLKLKENKTTTVQMTGTGATRTANASNGVWEVHMAGGSYTGVDITVDDGAVTGRFDQYSLSPSISYTGTVNSATLSATVTGPGGESGEISAVSNTVFFRGDKVVFTATGEGADSYTYEWSGTHGDSPISGTGQTLTIDAVEGKIELAVTVTGGVSTTVTTAEALKTALTASEVATINVTTDIAMGDNIEVGADHTLNIAQNVTVSTGEHVLTIPQGKTLTLSGTGTLKADKPTSGNIGIAAPGALKLTAGSNLVADGVIALGASTTPGLLESDGGHITIQNSETIDHGIYGGSDTGNDRVALAGGSLTVQNTVNCGIEGVKLDISDHCTVNVASTDRNNAGLQVDEMSVADSTVNIENTAGKGLTVKMLTVENSAVTVANTAGTGILINDYEQDGVFNLKNSTLALENTGGIGLLIGASDKLLIDGSTVTIAASGGTGLERDNITVQVLGASSGKLILAEGAKLKGVNGIFRDRGRVFNGIGDVTVAAENGAASEDALTAGDYVWDGTRFAKGGETVFPVTLNIYKDDVADAALGNIILTLKLKSDETQTVKMTGSGATRTANAPDGVWKVYMYGGYTGVDITVDGGAATGRLDQYSGTFNVDPGGSATGGSLCADITCLDDGSTIVNDIQKTGYVFLKGEKVVFTATGEGAGSYTYAWSGTHGSETISGSGDTLTIDSVVGKVELAVTITGKDTPANTWSGDGAALTNVADGDTITITNTATGTLTIPDDATVTIIGTVTDAGQVQLALGTGAKVNWAASYTGSCDRALVQSNTTGTIGATSTIEITGKIINTGTTMASAIVASGDVVVTGGTVSGQLYGVSGANVTIHTGSTVTSTGDVAVLATKDVVINGGTITGGSGYLGNAAISAQQGSVTLAGGMITAHPGARAVVSGVDSPITVTGNVAISGDVGLTDFQWPSAITINAGGVLTVPQGGTLTVTNSGTIINNGAIVNSGTIVNNGTITNHAGSTYTGAEPTGTGTFTPPPAAVTNVTVSPTTATIQKGTTKQFTASVTGTNNPAQTVTWTVEGGKSGTGINSSGLLTVAADETAATLTVKATSAVDTSKSGTATVTVTNIPVITYVLTVTGGTGSGSYAQGATVTITANAAPSGQRFKEWTVNSGGVTLANPQAQSTSFTMPASAVGVTATYEALPVDTYAITVQNDGNGTASANVNSAAQGATITLTATANSGYRFKEWQVVSGGVSIANNSFTMPAVNVTVKAIFERIPAVSISSATVSGVNASYTQTGSAIKPVPVVMLNGAMLTEQTDYTVSYSNNVSVGTATITITGIGNYTGTKTVTFTIKSSGGGNGGGGGGSSSGSTTTVTPPDPGKPDTATNAETKVTPTVGADGSTTVTVPEKSVTDVIKAAQDAAKKAGTEKNGVSVTIDVTTAKGTSDITATLTTESVNALIKASVTEVQIKCDAATITLDLDALKAAQAVAGGAVTVSAKPVAVNTLSAAAQKAIGNRPVFKLALTSGDKAVTNFGNGSVSMAIPYTLAANEKAENMQAVYVDDSGKVSWFTDSSYDTDSKMLLFSTDHFSVFGVGYRANNPVFADIANHWAKGDIDFVAARGLLSGTGSNQFSPDTNMTRGMFVTALGRLAGIAPADYKTGKFTDVKADAYYAAYVNWAAEKGIVSGSTAVTFAPDTNISREQMAVIMQNYAKTMGYTVPKTREAVAFADNANIASWAKDAVQAMQIAGVVSGKDAGRFDPQGTATRAEVAAVLHRYVELVIDPAAAQG